MSHELVARGLKATEVILTNAIIGGLIVLIGSVLLALLVGLLQRRKEGKRSREPCWRML